jgi:hypothetical protein
LKAARGLPLTIVETVAFHHTPGLVREGSLAVIGAAPVANAMVDAVLRPAVPGGAGDGIDLEQIGLAYRLDEWKAIADKEVAGHCS